MDELQIKEWLQDELGHDGAETHEKTTLGWILADIDEYTFDMWLELPPYVVVDEYLNITNELSQDLVDQYKFSVEQEDLLDTLDIKQTPLADPPEILQAFKSGMIDILKSLSCYFKIREEVATIYNTQ